MDTIINSSELTQDWLTKIRVGIDEAFLSVNYDEKKYWAKFESPITNRVFAWLYIGRKKINLFIGLDPDIEPDVEPSSSQWKRFKSIFRIDSDKKIRRAIDLIIHTFNHDLNN